VLGLAQSRFSIQRDLATGLAFYRQSQEQVRLFMTGIIPQARLTVEAMRAAYTVDNVDFLNLVSAQITLYNYETRYWQVLSEANQSLAAIEATVGEEFTNENQ
jgi:outer membrane protein, heavy metal efflux system